MNTKNTVFIYFLHRDIQILIVASVTLLLMKCL